MRGQVETGRVIGTTALDREQHATRFKQEGLVVVDPENLFSL